jgi:hypothetical protein
LSIRSKILTTFATSWNPREHRKLSSRPIFADSPNGPKPRQSTGSLFVIGRPMGV